MKKIAIINGPNLNLLGTREPDLYGSQTLPAIEDGLKNEFKNRAELEFFQSNHEGQIIDFIQKCKSNFIVINAGALTHTSVGIRDALTGVNIPFYEVHLSNIAAREDFRHKSYLSDKAAGVLFGFGVIGYSLAITAILAKK